MTLAGKVTYFLWFSAPLFQLALAIALRRQRPYLQLNTFFAYLVFTVCRSAALFVVLQASSGPVYYAYFWLFWGTELVEIALNLALVHELYECSFASDTVMRRFVDMLFRSSAVVLILVSAVAVALSPVTNDGRLMAAILNLKEAAGIVRIGLLLILFYTVSIVGLNWRDYLFGIALGLSFHAIVEIVVASVRSRMGPVANTMWPIVNGFAYHVTLLIWAKYLLRPRQYHAFQGDLPRFDFEGWNAWVKGIIRQ